MNFALDLKLVAILVIFVGWWGHATFLSYTTHSDIQEARDSVAILEKSIEFVDSASKDLEIRLAIQDSIIQADSAGLKREREDAEQTVRLAEENFQRQVGALYTRLDSAGTVALDNIVLEHQREIEALDIQVKSLVEENTQLRNARLVMAELIAAEEEENNLLRSEIDQLNIQISGYQKLIDPPWHLKVFDVAPEIALGIGVGYILAEVIGT